MCHTCLQSSGLSCRRQLYANSILHNALCTAPGLGKPCLLWEDASQDPYTSGIRLKSMPNMMLVGTKGMRG